MENEKHLPVIKEFSEVFTRLIYVVFPTKKLTRSLSLR